MITFAAPVKLMSFLFPYVLWGLLAISVPVIIHLFNFKRFRKVYFTNVRFLEELKQKTKRQSQLRHLLVMLLRMLAIASLVFAFAQPYLPGEDAAMQPDAVNKVSIYIDNSFSMEALSAAGPLIETAKAGAREIVSAFRTTDQFMLLTNDFEGRHQRWVSQEEFLQLLDEIRVSPNVRTVSEVVSRQNDQFRSLPGQSGIAYLVSDFQLNMADFENIVTDSLVSYWLVPLSAVNKDNLYIDSCWFATPMHQLNQGVRLMARIVNDSGTDYEKVPLKLMITGMQKAVAGFDVKAGTYLDVELPFTNYEAGYQFGTLEIVDYPVTFDDRMHLAFHVAGAVPVLAIHGGDESLYLNSLFGKDSAIRFVNNSVRNIDFNNLQAFELIILNELRDISSGLAQELSLFLGNAGTLLIIPSPEMDIASFQAFLSSAGVNYYTGLIREETKVSALDFDHPVFADVFEKSGPGRRQDHASMDLPAVNSFFGLSRGSRTAQINIMGLLNGRPFLTMETPAKGEIYLLVVPLEDTYSNFPRHALFVPVLFRIALLSAATAPLYYTIGRDNQLELSNTGVSGDKMLKIAALDDSFEFIPGQQTMNKRINLQLFGQMSQAGHYRLHQDGVIVRGLAFNYDRMESSMQFAGEDDLYRMIARYVPGQFRILAGKGKPLTETIKAMSQGTPLWKIFVILALVFLAFEIILLRFWKTSR
ncbi:MAG: BatA domain-containing protein [Bacteroidales bacterium]|nr:BatA domain-containing protein [Bacteroidales bacterium]